MKIIVGLGNPGKEYENTRHNLGFSLLDHLKDCYQFTIEKKMGESLVGETTIQGEKYLFVKPQTFMNLSGNAVNYIINWYKCDSQDVTIVFDDIDIPFGSVRFKENGSGGSHNGMKNIIQMCGTDRIKRLRIGIGGLKHEQQDLADFVLQKFTTEQKEKLPEIWKECESILFHQ